MPLTHKSYWRSDTESPELITSQLCMTTGSPTRPRSAMVTLTKYSTKASALSSRSQTLIYNTAPLLCSIRAFQWGQTFLFFFFLVFFFFADVLICKSHRFVKLTFGVPWEGSSGDFGDYVLILPNKQKPLSHFQQSVTLCKTAFTWLLVLGD